MSHWSRLEFLWWQLTFRLWAIVTWNTVKECQTAWSDEEQLHGREQSPLRVNLTHHTLQAYKQASGYTPNVWEWFLFFAVSLCYSLRESDIWEQSKTFATKVCFKFCQQNSCMKPFESSKGALTVPTRADVSNTLTSPHDVPVLSKQSYILHECGPTCIPMTGNVYDTVK